MQTNSRRLLLWLPWLALAAFGVLLGAGLLTELMREGEAGLTLAERLLNLALRTLPLGLLLVALGVVIEVLEEKVQTGHLTARARRWLFWMPRAAVLAFAGFVSLFSLDVFGTGYGFWETVTTLLMHMIPVFLMLIAIAVAWRWEWIGGVFFTGWALWYVLSARGFPLEVYLSLAALPFVLGVLFLLNWLYRDELRRPRASAHDAPTGAAIL